MAKPDLELVKRPSPTVGRTVLFTSSMEGETGVNGGEVPAIITRVWSDDCVNLMVMRDGPGETPHGVTSVMHRDVAHGMDRGWRWPDIR